jgi:hypothetical protein
MRKKGGFIESKGGERDVGELTGGDFVTEA